MPAGVEPTKDIYVPVRSTAYNSVIVSRATLTNMISNHRNIVEVDADILGGTPVFAGTRVPVDTLLAHLKAGDTIDTFLSDFPSVSREQVEVCLELGMKLVAGNGRDAHSS